MNPKRDLRQARYERASWWLAHGVDVVPLKPQSKELQPGYGARKAHIQSHDVARQWFLNTDANLGVVLGGSSGLMVVDWDDAYQYEVWCATTSITMQTLTEQTARGYHVYFTIPGLRMNISHGCELKATGVCMVAPSVHPSGIVYRILHDVPIATLDSENATMLFPFLSEAFAKQNRRDSASGTIEPGFEKSQIATRVTASVIARIKAARLIVDEMVAAKVELQPVNTNIWVGLCPFHPDHTPSLWVYPRKGLWGCNRPDCPAAGTHDVINFRAMHRGISNAAAIKQLASEIL
jgi:hypothetical protein